MTWQFSQMTNQRPVNGTVRKQLIAIRILLTRDTYLILIKDFVGGQRFGQKHGHWRWFNDEIKFSQLDFIAFAWRPFCAAVVIKVSTASTWSQVFVDLECVTYFINILKDNWVKMKVVPQYIILAVFFFFYCNVPYLLWGCDWGGRGVILIISYLDRVACTSPLPLNNLKFVHHSHAVPD